MGERKVRRDDMWSRTKWERKVSKDRWGMWSRAN